MNEIYKNYLKHHGILGQKWGRRNGPPYPLSAGAHSAAEKKAGWRKSLDKGSSGSTESKGDVFADLNRLKSENPPSFKLPASDPSVQSYIKRQELSAKVNEKLSSNDEWYKLAKKIHKENPDIDGNNIDELKKHYTKDDIDRILEKSGYPSSDSSRQYVEDFLGKKYVSYLEDEDTNGGRHYKNAYELTEQRGQKIMKAVSDSSRGAAWKKDENFNKLSALAKEAFNDADIASHTKEYERSIDLRDAIEKEAKKFSDMYIKNHADLKDTISKEAAGKKYQDAEKILLKYANTDEKNIYSNIEKLRKEYSDSSDKAVRLYMTAIDNAMRSDGLESYSDTLEKLDRLPNTGNYDDETKAKLNAIEIYSDAFRQKSYEYRQSLKHSDHLEHHGILGQKWGHRNGPPYPLGAGDHSAAEKKAGWRQSLGSYMKAKKEKKRQTAVEAHEAAKKDALESGDADKILRFRKELTNNELNDALNRARTVNNLRSETESNRLRDVKKAMDTVKTIKDAVNLGIDSVETARKLKKTFTPEKKEKPNDFEKSLQNSLEQFGKMSVDELMKTDTMKKLKDTREAGEEYNKLKKAVNKVTDDDDKKKDKK